MALCIVPVLGRQNHAFQSSDSKSAAMPAEFMSMIAFFGGALIAMMSSGKLVGQAVRTQQDIAKRGVPARATVLRLWQPPLQGAFVRIYFEFQPDGAGQPIRTCHVDRRGTDEPSASLPQIGAQVAIRYLPDDPAHAVIVRLVSRLAR